MLAAVALLYPEVVFEGKVFVSGDSQAAASYAAVGNQALAKGEYPVWNPYLFCGMPSFGSMAFTPRVYPVNWIIKPIRRLFFLPEYSWLLFHSFATGLGVFLLLRNRGIGAAAAIAGGVLMIWMPNLVAIGANGHGSQACAVAYLPFALLFWDRFWRGQGVVVNAAALAIALGFSMLRSHLQVSYYTYALVVLHLVFFGTLACVDAARRRSPASSPLPGPVASRVRRDGVGGWRAAFAEIGFSASLFAVVVVVSLLIAAVLYLPVQDYAKYSIRGASSEGGLDYGYATNWSLHPSEMLTFLVPFSFGFGKDLYLGHMPFTDYPNYLGLVVLAFACVALFRVRGRWVAFLAFVVLVATLVSFGKFLFVLYGPLFKFALLQQVPRPRDGAGSCSSSRDPIVRDRARPRAEERPRAVTLAGLRGLSGGGLLRAGASRRVLVGRLRARSGVRACARPRPGHAADGGAHGRRSLARDLIQPRRSRCCSPSTFAFASSARMRPAVFACAVLALGTIDYYRVDRFILHPERFRHHDGYRILRDRSTLERYTASDELIEFLRQQEGVFRVFPMDDLDNPVFSSAFMSNRYMVFDIASVGGYHPAKLSAYDEFMRALAVSMQNGRFDLLNMVNARYIVSGVRLPDHPALRPVWVGEDYEGNARAIYANADAFPRAWVAGEFAVATGDEALAMLREGPWI
jgi:hypothetical protein